MDTVNTPAPADHTAADTRPTPASWTKRAMAVAVAMFVVGVVAIVAIFVLELVGADPVVALYWVSMLSPLGMLVGFAAVFASNARTTRQVRAARREQARREQAQQVRARLGEGGDV